MILGIVLIIGVITLTIIRITKYADANFYKGLVIMILFTIIICLVIGGFML